MSRLPTGKEHSMCPTTGKWFDADAAIKLKNPSDNTNISKIVFPVAVRNKNDNVYELSELVEIFRNYILKNKAPPFQIENLEPARYPGFTL